MSSKHHFDNWLWHDVSMVFQAMHDGDSDMTAQMLYELTLQSGHVPDAVKELEICLCQAAKVFGRTDATEMVLGIDLLSHEGSDIRALVQNIRNGSFSSVCESKRYVS